MKAPEELAKTHRRLNLAKGTRTITGILSIIATLGAIACGFVALARQEDAWLAMKWPMLGVILLLAVFTKSTRKILDCEAILRR